MLSRRMSRATQEHRNSCSVSMGILSRHPSSQYGQSHIKSITENRIHPPKPYNHNCINRECMTKCHITLCCQQKTMIKAFLSYDNGQKLDLLQSTWKSSKDLWARHAEAVLLYTHVLQSEFLRWQNTPLAYM